ncbi:tetratricopeptide repeat protein [Aquabacterium sp. A3]|uniref:tetratricopeptide repeat protein n=1 Tax=Aquabacterium sp. A3 TaxID=3132829 RepID=UPI00311A1399
MATVTPYSNLSALIIDDMATQQSTLRGHLNLLGISKVEMVSTPEDALRNLRGKKYNLVLCDYNLNAKTDGQQLFEYARDNQLLPPDTLFFMITAESTYASVAAATEQHPDAYLLKPITATDIEERLKVMLDKRDALLAIHTKLSKDDLVGALAECDAVLAQKNRWTMSAMQTKGSVLLKLGRHEEAKAIYRAALDVRSDLTWARLGLARAHKAAGQFQEAQMLARDIIESRDGDKNVAAYDVIAESLEALGDPEGAMWVLRDAAQVVPSARRQRLLGESAYRNGDLDTAKDALGKATKSSKGSVMAQPQDTLLLAQTLVDMGTPSDALKVLQEGQTAFRSNPGFDNVALAVQAQAEVGTGATEQALKTVARARETMRKGKADFATVALAKAEIMTGNEDAGFKLLESAISADHENRRIKQMISKALRDTGHEDKIESVIESAAAGLQSKVSDARKLLRDSKIDDAVAMIEAAVREYPENTGVLLQAAQINCMALRLKKDLDATRIERIRTYLTRLEKLLPGHDRVNTMRRYFRETLGLLEATSLQD